MIKIEKMTLSPYAKGVSDNREILVTKGCPEDIIEPIYLKKKQNYDFVNIKNIIQASPYRNLKPKCKFNDICGSCQWQQIDYKYQLRIKEELALEELQNAKLNIKNLNPIIPMQDPFNFRNKVIYPIQQENTIKAGYYTLNTHTLIDISSCEVHYPIFNKIISTFKNIVDIHNLNNENYMRYIVLRSNYKQTEVALELVLNVNNINDIINSKMQHLCNLILRNYSEIVSFVLNFNNKLGNTILTNTRSILYQKNEGYIQEEIDNIKFLFSSNTFFQTNIIQYTNILQKIKTYIHNIQPNSIIDAYSGTGTIGLFLAKHYPHISFISIENNDVNIKYAKLNQVNNNISNITFIHSNMDIFATSILNKSIPNVIIVNPPRKGIDTISLNYIISSKIEYVIYISCSIISCAKDLKYLEQYNYQIQDIQLYDMFPHTFHFETVTLLKNIKIN